MGGGNRQTGNVPAGSNATGHSDLFPRVQHFDQGFHHIHPVVIEVRVVAIHERLLESLWISQASHDAVAFNSWIIVPHFATDGEVDNCWHVRSLQQLTIQMFVFTDHNDWSRLTNWTRSRRSSVMGAGGSSRRSGRCHGSRASYNSCHTRFQSRSMPVWFVKYPPQFGQLDKETVHSFAALRSYCIRRLLNGALLSLVPLGLPHPPRGSAVDIDVLLIVRLNVVRATGFIREVRNLCAWMVMAQAH